MNHQTTIRVPSERTGLRADVYLALTFPSLSRSRIRQKIQQGEALLNGRRFATSARLRGGDEVSVRWRGAVPSSHDAPGHLALPVLFEDRHFIAVDKPAGLASHPSGAFQTDTVIQIVRAMLRSDTERALERGDRDRYPILANRLDRLTSGVVLVAKHRQALAAFQELRTRKLVEKRYLAVVEGVLREEEGSIGFPLGPDPGSRVTIKMSARSDGLPCRTDYRVIRRLARHTLVQVFPRTGRQHQIRAHFALLGHPVWGDVLYKDEEVFLRRWEERGGDPSTATDGGTALPPAADGGIALPTAMDGHVALPSRHLLHAELLAFPHPEDGRRVEIASGLPQDFLSILEGLS